MNTQHSDGNAGDDLIMSTTARTEIVFIEDNVTDYQALARDLGNGREVVILDSTKDGVQQIAATLAGRSGIDALHIISHGSAGSVNLGALTLDAASARDHQADLNAIGLSMAKGGDILLYGCDTGAGTQGRTFVDDLAIATGADVAASNDITGANALGGDWQLEVSRGDIETASLATMHYNQALGVNSALVDFQTGSFTTVSATHDVLYQLPTNTAYQLQVHSPSATYPVGELNGNLAVEGIFYPGHPLEVSFAGGENFSLSSIALGVHYESMGYIPGGYGGYGSYGGGLPQSTTVTITGEDANGHVVETQTVVLVANSTGANNAQFQTINFSGMTDIKVLKIDEGAGAQYTNWIYVDNLNITNIHAQDTTPPTTTNASVAFSADTGASSTDLITQTAAQSISGTLSANLASDEHVEVSLDNGAHWTTASATVGTNTWLLSATLTGSDTLKVRVVDSGGNAGTADSHAYTLDNSAPAASSTPVLDAASDTGSSHSDGITAATTPTFTGTAEAGATVDLYEGSTLLGSAVATGGIWSITSSALGAGQHTVSTIVTDAAGNASGASAGLTFTVDLTAPTTTVGGIAFSADHGASNTDFITNVAAQTISGTLSAALQTGEQVEVSLDNGATWTAAQVNGTAWSLAATLAGSGTLQARVVDAVDNAGPVASQAYVLDMAAPTVTITSDVAALKAGETATVTFTFSEDPGATFTWDGAQGDVVVSGGTLSAIGGSGLVRTATFTPDAGTDGGTASITIGAGSYADTAGNMGGAGTTPSLHFDTLAPAVPLAHLSPPSDSGAMPFDGVTRVVTPTIDGFAEAGSTITLYDTDGTTVLGSTVATNGIWSITTSTLSEGVHTITARASDAAGNESAASLGTQVTIDTTAPDAPSTPTPGATTTSDTTPTFTGTAAAGAAVDLFDTDGATVLGSTVADGNGAWSITATTMGEGTHTVTAKATDLAGNTSTASPAQSITIDTTAPAASSTPVLDAASDTGVSHSDGITAATTPTFTGTAEAGATVDLYEGSTLLGSAVATGGIWSITSSALGAGQHTVSTIVTDAAGNASGASAGLTFTVDLTAPTTTVGGIAFSADQGASGTDFITNTAAQTISGTLSAALQTGEQVQVSLDNGASWTAAQVNGTAWSLAATLAGSGTLQVRVVDAVDNAGPVASQAYVLDTAAPTVTITSDVAALKAGETATVTFTFSEDPGASFTWDGTQGDVAVSGGTLSAIGGSGLVRTATFTPDAGTDGGTASITIGAGSYADTAGNTGGAGTTPSLHFDTLVPDAPSAPQLAASSSDVTRDTTPTLTGTAEAGSTVTLYDTDGTTVLGSTVATNGTWSIDAATLGEGAHTVTARATDAAGNAGAVSSGTTFTVDTTAPTVTIGSDASALKVGETATVTFTFSEDPGASFTWDGTQGDLVVGGGTLSAVSGSGLVRTATFTPAAHVNGGTASITIAAGAYADRAGNDGAAGSLPALHFDTLAPAASSTPVLDAASDTGVSNSDGITAATTPTFTGTAEAGATVDLYEGSTLLGSAVATGGIWSITSSALGAGQHTVSTIVTDAAGNASGASAGLTFTVDLTAPTTTVGGIAFSADQGASGTDFITNTAAQTISGTLSAALQTGEQVQVSLDNGASWTAAQVNGTAWSLAATLAGSGTLQVRVVDAVDNAGPVASQAYVLDTAAPTVTITSDVAALKAGETATVTFTFSEDPGATFTWDGAQGDVVVSGGTLSAISGSGLVRTATFTPDASTDGGTASITLGAGSYADAAGNMGGAGTTPSLHFDTLAPDAPRVPVLQPASDTGAWSTDGITADATPTVNGTAEGHALVTLYDGATVLGTTTANAGGMWSITTPTLADGTHQLRITQTDVAGNVSAQGAALAIVIDTHAPSAPAAPVLSTASDSGIAGDHVTKVTTPTFSGTAEAGAWVTLYDTDRTTALGSTQADPDGNWIMPASPLADGTHVLTVRQVDAAGNESAASPALTLTVDATAPAAPAAPQLQAQSDTDSVGDGVTYAVPVLEGNAAANDLVTLYDGTTVVGTTHADAHGHWTIAAQALGLGRHTLSVTDTDVAGNVSAASGSFALTVEEAPVPLVDGVRVVTVPVSLPGGASGTQVQVPIVSAGRVEQTGAVATADIPLAGGTDLLTAHVGIGYGLTASGGANTTVASGGVGLIAAIQAATTSDGDLVHMSGNGQSYLAQLQASESLLVQTIAPVSSQEAPDGVLTLSAGSSAQQQVALVIQTGGLAPGSTIALQNVNFAAIVGAANIVVQGGTQILTGDAASQHVTLASGGDTQVFSGGGDDTLGFGVPAARAASASGAAHANAASVPTTTVLHGGTGSDTATFAGARADFDVETHNGYLVVSSKAAPAAKALVVNVEQLQFSDATVKVEDSGAMDTLASIYQTALGRQADMYGIEFWADAHQAGVSWGRIALDIIRSPEYVASHDAFNGNAEHDLGMLYQALFDRAPDAPGLAFWVEAMRNGVSLEHIATEFVESVEMIGHQRAATDWDFIV
ncbi:Ig-like domain-containing protein [Massilia sp.]|uniref:Ig-like domain-containing protein n=1 Tax=Massilia sp. TaxID=1882437 RepID=UPI00352C0FCD